MQGLGFRGLTSGLWACRDFLTGVIFGGPKLQQRVAKDCAAVFS